MRKPEELRSHQWYGTEGLRSFSHRARTRQLGYLPEEHLGKPVIAILNTWSDINPCHVHLRDRAQAVKRGVWQAGGFPLEFPVSTLSETFQKPTPMLYRNLLSLETEELLRSYPVDGAVLMGGCDKSTPALLMGAASADLPAVFVPAGPMLPGHWRNEVLGSGTDMWKYWDDKRAGLIGRLRDVGTGERARPFARALHDHGHGVHAHRCRRGPRVTVPGASSIPAVDSGHERMAAASGRRIVELVLQDRRPSHILTREAFEDAVTTVLGLGGSTNAVIHLIAMAGRAGVPLTLDDFDRIARTTPVLANIRPGGDRYLMEDFHFAGGLPGFLSRIPDLLHLDRPTVCHDTLREQIAGARVHDDDVIRPRDNPVAQEGGVAVLRGNLCPDGAVIKHIAAEPHLLAHTGPAVVFDDYRTMQRTIDDPALGITADSVLVLRNAGPKGGPGMPEYGMLPIPGHLLKQGVRDMVRISDSRMSGTSYGACVLHVAPESYVGGPLALVRTGDSITLDVEARTLRLHVDDEELEHRLHDGPRPRRATSAATACSTTARSPRPTPAATSSSWPGAARCPTRTRAEAHGLPRTGPPVRSGIRFRNTEKT